MLLFIWHLVPSLCLPNDDDFKESVCHYLAITTCSHSVHLFNKNHSLALKSPLMMKKKSLSSLNKLFFSQGMIFTLNSRHLCDFFPFFFIFFAFLTISRFPHPPSFLVGAARARSEWFPCTVSQPDCMLHVTHCKTAGTAIETTPLFWFLQLPVMCLDDGAKCWLFSPL